MNLMYSPYPHLLFQCSLEALAPHVGGGAPPENDEGRGEQRRCDGVIQRRIGYRDRRHTTHGGELPFIKK